MHGPSRMVLPALVTRSKLAIRQQQIDVITPNDVLCEIDDRHRPTCLSVMVVRSMFRNITDELRNLTGGGFRSHRVLENKMSSLLIKSENGIGLLVWSKHVPGCVNWRQFASQLC
jgi:hypothetical protein